MIRWSKRATCVMPALLGWLLTGGAGLTAAGGPVFPGRHWETRSPESQGVDSQGLERALAFLRAQCHADGIDEVVVIRHGALIHAGPHADRRHNIWSCSKTFTSTVLGLLIDDGRLSLADRAERFEPLLRGRYDGVTLRHFATMTSGYSARGRSRWNPAQYADWSATVYVPEDPCFAPGTAFAYWDEAQMMFGRVLTRVLGREMRAFLTERVTDPIGMGPWAWGTEGEVDGVPINNGCTGVQVNALQLARWGWLFRNEGRWRDRQLLSTDWVRRATRVRVPATIPVAATDRRDIVGPGCYGFNWWVNGRHADGTWKLPGAPVPCYFASGFNNNKCLVIPPWDMVVVRMGRDGHPADPDRVYGTFLERLGEALQP